MPDTSKPVMLALALTIALLSTSCTLSETPPVVVKGVCGRYSVIIIPDDEFLALKPASRDKILTHNDKYLGDCP